METRNKKQCVHDILEANNMLKGCFECHDQIHHFSPKSLFCCGNGNRVRKWVVWLITWKWFDHFVTVVILVNSVILAMRDYGDRLESTYVSQINPILEEMGKILSLIFIVECTLKIIGMGFVFHKTSYLRDPWNILDFFVVCASFLDWDLFPELDQFSSLKVLRTFRILRPLRSINKVKKMKMLINSLLKSIPGLMNVMIFLFFIMSIFAIFSTHQFKGAQYQRCRTTNYETQKIWIDGVLSDKLYWPKQNSTQWLCRDNSTCQGWLEKDPNEKQVYICGIPSDVGLSQTQDLAERDELIMFDIINFNNFPAAMRSIFVAISLEGWILMLYNYSDANQPFLSAVFFIFLVIFGAFFALNLVLAEVIESYYSSNNEEQQKVEMAKAEAEKQKRIAEEKENPIIEEIQEEQPGERSQQALIQNVDQAPEEIILVANQLSAEAEDSDELEKEEEVFELNARKRAESNRCLNCFFQMVTAPWFNLIIVALIVVNTAVLAYDSYPISSTDAQILLNLNITLTLIFFAEMCLKLVGLGPQNYFKDSFNVFDCVVVLLSIVDFVIMLTIDEDEIGSAADALQALRALRLLRIIKLARSWTELQEILRKTAMSLKDIGYFSVLLFLFAFIISLLGMELFANECRFNAEHTNQLITVVKDNKNEMVAPRANFDTISNALITTFIIILGEDWPGVMYNYVRVYDLGEGNSGAAGWAISLFFILVFTVGNFLLLSLFVAILLQNFEEKSEDEEEDDDDIDIKKLSESTMLASNYSSSDYQQPKKPLEYKWHEFMIELKYEYVAAFGTTMAINDAAKLRQHRKVALKELWEKSVEGKDNQVVPVSELMAQIGKEQTTVNMDSATKNSKASKSNEKKKKIRTMASVQLPDKNPPQASYEHESDEQSIFAEQKVPTNGVFERQRTIANSLTHLELHLSVHKKQEKKEKKREIRGHSLFVLSPENFIRKFCNGVVTCWLFDWIILVFICISTINLAIESPLDDPKSPKVVILEYIDYVMTAIFIFEAVLKIIAFGFLFNGKQSYLRDGWCILDFIIVLISIFGIAFKEYNLTYLKVLRMLRIMKPLRMLTMMRSLRLAIISLFKSIPDILNLLLICTFFIFLLSILSMTLFKGKFYSCDTKSMELNLSYTEKEELIKDKWDCLNYGGEWINQDLNFDTTSEAFITLFTVQSTEGWIDVMWSSVDAVGIDKQPEVGYRKVYMLYFIVLIVLLCMLFLNLFVGVVCETFNKENENLSFNHLLGKDTQNWIKVQIMAYSARPAVKIIEDQPQVNWLRNQCIKITNHKYFDNIIMVCILLNTVALAVVWHNMPKNLIAFLENLNLVFMGIFTIEAIIKLIALKTTYFKDNWNNFDFLVVIGSLIAVGFKFIPALGIDLSMQSTMVRILRVLRVIRIIKRAKKLQIICETIVAAAPAMGSLGLLLLLLVFMFAIIGMQLFAMVKLEGAMDKHANFQYFNDAFLLLMRCATGEGWNSLMYDTARTHSITFQCDENPTWEKIQLEDNKEPNGCGFPKVATIYFISFQIIVSQVFLNLFIAIVVDTFINMKQTFDLPIKQTDIDTFVQLWKVYDPQGSGYILAKDLENLLLDLSESDTFFFQDDPEQIAEPLQRLNLLIYLEIPMHKGLSCFMFYDVLSVSCRYTCETSHKLIQKRREEINFKLVSSAAFKQRYYRSAVRKHILNTMMLQDEQCLALFSHMFVTTAVDDRVELKIDVNAAAKGVNKRYGPTIDSRPPCDHHEDIELYTSKHYYNMVKVARHWIRRIAKKKSSTQSTRMDCYRAKSMSPPEHREGNIDFAPVARPENVDSRNNPENCMQQRHPSSKSKDSGEHEEQVDQIGELPVQHQRIPDSALMNTNEVQMNSQELQDDEDTHREANKAIQEPNEKSVKKQPR